MKPKLKPCPFCGKAAQIEDDRDAKLGVWIRCERHQDMIAWVWGRSMLTATRRWNTRKEKRNE